MASRIYLGPKHYVDVDRFYTDAPRPAQWLMQSGRPVMTEPGSPGRPTIWEIAGGFYYAGGLTPVTDPTHLEQLPKDAQPRVKKWLATHAATAKALKPKPLTPTTKPPRGGKPAPRPENIDTPEAFRRVHGAPMPS